MTVQRDIAALISCVRRPAADDEFARRVAAHSHAFQTGLTELEARILQRWQQFAAQAQARVPARPLLPGETAAFVVDFLYRSVMLADVLRERGNEFLDYEESGQPPLLAFDYEVLIDGRDLPQPVNYCLLRILPPEGVTVDPGKRPYLIIDPRAGHGAGIGGFKQDSQVGVTLQAGNPVYFAVFYPEPEPGQTMGCVAAAQLRFVREVARRHPTSPKPALVGNCQGGWAVMALAAVDPDITGPVVLNGAPLSYWAGVHGRNPLRYLGGLAGGSWPAYLLGDLGNGRFDGAWLVQNFEALNPANTLWGKYYKVFAEGDAEARRFLDFEKWWGGFVQLTSDEMRGIVDNLFVGNKLATHGIALGSGQTLDLRRIRSPVVVFCSQGDNITPPQQALNWIADTYLDTREIKAHGQTIVYIVHEDAGHLGIFVSGSVVRREFTQIAGTLANIEALPPGLYELEITDSQDDGSGVPQYEVSLHERSIEDILARDDTREDESQFRVVAAVSELNGRFYELFVAPWMRSASSAWTAYSMKEWHPMRMQRRMFSDLSPWLWWLPNGREALQPLVPELRADNPWRGLQQTISDGIEASLETFTELRDATLESLFHAVYGTLELLGAGERIDAGLLVPAAAVENAAGLALAAIDKGGMREAVVRMLLLMMEAGRTVRSETVAYVQSRLRGTAPFADIDPDTLRALLVMQSTIVAYEPARALETLPSLLPTPAMREEALQLVKDSLPPSTRERDSVKTALASFERTLAEHAPVGARARGS